MKASRASTMKSIGEMKSKINLASTGDDYFRYRSVYNSASQVPVKSFDDQA